MKKSRGLPLDKCERTQEVKKVQGAPGDDLDEGGGHKTGLAAHPGQVPDDHDEDDYDDDGQVPVHVQAVAQLDLQAYVTIFNRLVAKYFQLVAKYFEMDIFNEDAKPVVLPPG